MPGRAVATGPARAVIRKRCLTNGLRDGWRELPNATAARRRARRTRRRTDRRPNTWRAASARRGSRTPGASLNHPFTGRDMSLLDLVQQNLGPDQIQEISQQIGADPGQTQSAVQAALPMLLGGMAGAAQ